MTDPLFGRVLTAMVTPFAIDGTIDFDVAIELAEYLVANGSDGLVLAGSTGEGSALSEVEKLELFACVAGAVEVPVLAGMKGVRLLAARLGCLNMYQAPKPTKFSTIGSATTPATATITNTSAPSVKDNVTRVKRTKLRSSWLP